MLPQTKILLIEDNEGDIRLVKDLLKLSHPDRYDITAAMTLKAGLTLLDNNEFDIVLTDLSLPDVDGTSTVTFIQDHDQSIPIVVLSGQDNEEFALQIVQMGAQDYLVKGKGDGELISRVVNYSIERKRNEQRLIYLANYDSLTGLANRLLFQERLDRAFIRANRNKTLVALLMIDLDQFKKVNDTLGHDTGDELLVKVASRFEGCTRDGDTIARLGGDEFTIIMEDLKNFQNAVIIAEKILDSMKSPFKLASYDGLYASPSIGISVYPLDDAEGDNLLKNADSAMYSAKEKGRNRYCFYTSDMNQKLLTNLNMEAKLRHAIDKEELMLYYQPKFTIDPHELIGAEALIRWNDPEEGMIPPISFIPLAEESDLINAIGDWTIEKVCKQNFLWQQKGYPPIRVAINLSPKQFRQENIAINILERISSCNLEAKYIELEITEGTLMEDVDKSNRILKVLKENGIHVAIDDFGTGYSSLSYLKKFDVDILKIDQSFIRDLLTDTDDVAIVSAIIAMAKSLKLRVIAEGVETKEQLHYLAEQGCNDIQGYLFGKPVPAEEFLVFFKDRKL